MRRGILLYLLLVLSVLFQISVLKGASWCPDMILLIAMFAAIFYDTARGVIFCFTVGCLRGLLSVYTLPVDMAVFPLLALIAAVISRVFYRQNPVTYVLVVSIAIFSLIISHVVYFDLVSNISADIGSVLFGSWKTIASTILVSPLLFPLLNKLMEARS